MLKVNADPVFKRGDLAVWMLQDIPPGIMRRGMADDIKAAFLPHVIEIEVAQLAADVAVGADHKFMACVAWGDLQPLHPVPRGYDTMLPAHWGLDRDADGVCTVCNADDSMWCDTVAHNQALAAVYGATLIKHTRAARDIHVDLYGLKHGPGQRGGRGPCEPACRKCRLEQELGRALAADRKALEAGAGVSPPPTPSQPSQAQRDRMLANTMGSRGGERYTPPSIEARAAWSRELRRLTQASTERERNRVLVDRDFEDWE